MLDRFIGTDATVSRRAWAFWAQGFQDLALITSQGQPFGRSLWQVFLLLFFADARGRQVLVEEE